MEREFASDRLLRRENLLVSLSGIRGTIPQGLDPENVVHFIRAFAEVSGKRIVLGRDTRPSSPFLHHLSVGTLIAAGKEVLDIGVVPTPTVKCLVKSCKAAGGIMISASHNPLIWNGFKFIGKDGLFFDRPLQQSWLKALQSDTSRSTAYLKTGRLGTYRTVASLQTHIDAVLKFLPDLELVRQKSYTVVVDAVGGAGSQALPALLEKLGCKVIPLHCSTDTLQKFPRPPEPNPAALRLLVRLVKKHRAAIGFGLDPDADRLAIASLRSGAVHEEYSLPLALLGLEPRLKKQMQAGKPNHLVVNLSTSLLCDQVGAAYKAKVFRSAVGEVNVVGLMQKKKALFGGEGNGGVILPEIPSYGRDPLAGAALILTAMARANAHSIDDLLVQLPPLFMHKSKEKLPNASFEDISEKFLLEFPEARVNYSDGLYLSLPDQSWLHLRPSNTEPALRLIIETPNSKRLSQIATLAKRTLRVALKSHS